jgi:cell fate (sporulation/competence/biofilm development) regulator YlbF (YheA/YmcA/DUF963 family)
MSERAKFHLQHGVYLTKLRQLKELHQRCFYVFDVETKDGLLGKKLFCYSLAYLNDKSHKLDVLCGNSDLGILFDFFNQHKGSDRNKIVFVHNLGFDVRFIIDYVVKKKIMDLNVVKSNIVSVGGSIIGFTIPSLKIQFRDSFQFLRSSQERAELDYEVDKELLKIDCKSIFNKKYRLWTKKEKETVINHNKNDVMALYSIMNCYRNIIFELFKIDFLSCLTLASLGLKCFRTTIEVDIPNPFIYLKFNQETKRREYWYEKPEESFCRSAYFGGRCEVFDLNKHFDCIYLDKVSMYPGVMVRNKMPFGFGYWERDKIKLNQIIESESEISGFIEVIVKYNMKVSKEATKYPVLPVKLNERTCFTNCTIRGVYTIPELRYAYQCGYDIEVKQAFLFEDMKNIFDKYILKLFEVKKTSKFGRREVAKRLMNALSGKFGQRIEQNIPKYTFFESEDQLQSYLSENPQITQYSTSINKDTKICHIIEKGVRVSIKSFMNVCLSAYITSIARVELIKQIHELFRIKIPAFYSDSDSIVTTKSCLKYLTLSKELGGWDIEKDFDEIVCLAPKCYVYKKDNVIKIVVKGLDRKKTEEIEKSVKTIEEAIELLKEPIELSERYKTLTQSLSGGYILDTKILSKHFSHKYFKREVLSDKTTNAWIDSTNPF